MIYKYLSQAMLRGFTTAAACFVFTTQLRHIFGVYEDSEYNFFFFKIFYVKLILNSITVYTVTVSENFNF